MTPVTLTADQNTEVTFISGVDGNGDVAAISFATWDGNTPATYSSGDQAKWGAGVAGSAGGVVSYGFAASSHWTAAEQTAFVMTLDLWAAEANISFVQASAANADILITRSSGSTNSEGGLSYYPGTIGTPNLGTAASGNIAINTSATGEGPLDGSFPAEGGYPWQVLLHEEGHALGLGHAGAYNGSVDPSTQQLGVYDARSWSLMSYIDPEATDQTYYAQETVKSGDWGTSSSGGYIWNNVAVTPGAIDILAAQRLYGLPTSTPLSGGQTFGFNCNIIGPIKGFFDFTQNTRPVVTLWDKGTGNTLDLSGYSTTSTIDLTPGKFSNCAGLRHNIAIAFGVQIDKVVGGSANDTLIANNDGDVLEGGGGNDTLVGGAGQDTALYAVASTQASWSFNGGGWIVSAGPDGTDTLTNIEQLQFTDRTVSLTTMAFVAAGSVTSAALTDDPSQPVLYAAGDAVFTDLAASATHSVSVTATAGDYGLLSAYLDRDSTGGGQGIVSWQYAVGEAAVAGIGPSQTVSDTFTLTLSDGGGAPVSELITVNLSKGGAAVNTRSGSVTDAWTYAADGTLLGHESAAVSGAATAYTYADGAGQVYAHRVTQDLGGGSFEYQDFDGAYHQRNATIHAVLGGGVTQDQLFDGAWNATGIVRTTVAGAQTVTQTFNGAWVQTSASIVTDQGGGTIVTQNFDGAWTQTSATIVRTSASGLQVIQNFDAHWNQISAEIIQHPSANVTEEQFFNASWQQTSAEIVTVNGNSSTTQYFDSAWTFTSATIATVVSPDLHVVRNYNAQWTETSIGQQAYRYGQTAGQAFIGGGAPTVYIFQPGQIDGDAFAGFLSGSGGAAAHDVIEFVGYGAGAHLTQLDASHWQVSAIGRASEIFTAAGLSPTSGDVQFVG